MTPNLTTEHTDPFLGLHTPGQELDYNETTEAGRRQATRWAETLNWLADK
ncbi:hypothetical protein [Corynebacterium mastitidis]|nr:hypothetical protein [Corynebacterium mastitidis]